MPRSFRRLQCQAIDLHSGRPLPCQRGVAKAHRALVADSLRAYGRFAITDLADPSEASIRTAMTH